MATNEWADGQVEAGGKTAAAKISGGITREFVATWEKATGDGNGTIAKLIRIPANAILTSLLLNCDAMVGLTGAVLGLYEEDGTTAIDADAFLTNTSLAAGRAIGSELNALAAPDLANLNYKVWEHAGHTISTKKGGYILALTLNTAGSTAGSVTLRGRYIEG